MKPLPLSGAASSVSSDLWKIRIYWHETRFVSHTTRQPGFCEVAKSHL
jgi:hypothetical protein